MSDTVTLALANFFYDVWQDYLDSPTEEIEVLLVNSDLVESYELTAEDIENQLYDGEEGDSVYVLTDLGKQAWSLASASPIEDTK